MISLAVFLDIYNNLYIDFECLLNKSNIYCPKNEK